jgi:SAM-dependent methyltransferase
MTERRLLFGSVAEQYDSCRPSYPQALVDDVLAFVGTPAREIDVLEVGAGTGIATRQFAPRVRHLTAIEPDAEMAAVAGAHAPVPGNVKPIQGDFEHAEIEPASVDLLISGTAWHWVTSELRNPLAARVLRPGGVLAPFWAGPEWSRSDLRSQLDDVYEQVLPDAGEQRIGVMYPRTANETGGQLQQDFADEWAEQIADEQRLIDPEVRFYRWEQSYTAAQYVALLGTHSDHLLLEPEVRARLFEAISALIDGPAGGSLELPYRSILCLARRSDHG